MFTNVTDLSFNKKVKLKITEKIDSYFKTQKISIF